MENNEIIQKGPAIKKSWLRILLFMLAFLFVMIFTEGILSFVIASILEINFTDLGALLTNPDFVGIQIFIQSITLLTTFLVIWIFRKYIDRMSIISMGYDIKGRFKDIIYGFLVGFVLISLGFIILFIFNNLEIITVQYNSKIIFGSFFFFLVAAIIEEIVFRGYILNNLLNSMKNKYLALLISSLLFALIHGLNPNLSLLSIINLVIAGLALGISYIHTKNLWFPIFLHVSWNYFQGPIYGFEVSGMDSPSIISQEVIGSDLITGGKFGFEGSIILTFLLIGMIFLVDRIYKKQNAVT